MPTYEYACTACGRRLEKHQSFSDEPLTVCEVCGGRLRRVFNPVGVLFKGSGFYSTDKGDSRVKTSSKSEGKSEQSKGSSSSNGGSGGDSGKGDSGKGDSGKGGSASGSKDSGSKSSSDKSGSSGSDKSGSGGSRTGTGDK